MKFSEFKYQRPNIQSYKVKFQNLLTAFNEAPTFEAQNHAFKGIIALRNEFETAMSIASVRYTQDTTNELFQAEQDFFDDNDPVYKGLVSEFYKAILKADYKNDLINEWGKQLFNIAELSVKTYDDSIQDDLKKENQLTSEYTKLLASAKIEFDSKMLNLSQIEPYLSATEREIRKKAQQAKYSFFTENADRFDELYDNLVKLRHGMALKLGFKSFTELAYHRMLRADYNSDMVASYRDQIAKHVVPLSVWLRDKQKKRLGLDKMLFYDEPLNFTTGNADPKGSPQWIVDNATKMYDELAPETSEFFHYMLENDLMDLEGRKGKATGGYCTVFNDYQSPFIFSNFNGTTHDIIVLTHEAGHAFQVYQSRESKVPEYLFPTFEACEIHSMSMEFITWPWMKLFFLEDETKFKFSHVSKALFFLPYGAAVDEFQHAVYEKPEMSPAERKASWQQIEKKYMPDRDNSDIPFLEEGGFWQQQRHIYNMPFYYIDYTLAQVCAFQFWEKSELDNKQAFNDYLRLCKAGGSKSFLELVKLAGLDSPFETGCVEKMSAKARAWLATVDDQKL